jgi:hypothetical protein
MRMFLSLQLADIATTLVFLSMGIAETNPLASYLMDHLGAFPGLMILKGAAVSIALLCNFAAHPTFVRRVNFAYMAVVGTNILTIVHGTRR